MDGNVYLINLVKKRPVLWNKSCQKVRDLEARNAAWKEIAAIIGVEGDWARTRWYNLRERFVKELKLSYREKHPSKFKYYEELLFLAKQVEFRRKPDIEFAAFIEQLPGKNKIPFNAEFDFTEEMVEEGEPLDEECIFKELNNKNNFENPAELPKDVSCVSSCERSESVDLTVPDEQTQSHSHSADCNHCFQKANGAKLLNHEAIAQEHRCEDAIFGELVTAILRKMSENKKKNAKKEIISILLA